MEPGKKANFRELLELKTSAHKVFTSYMQTGTDEWPRFVERNYRRKK